jgi:hypothetical protein
MILNLSISGNFDPTSRYDALVKHFGELLKAGEGQRCLGIAEAAYSLDVSAGAALMNAYGVHVVALLRGAVGVRAFDARLTGDYDKQLTALVLHVAALLQQPNMTAERTRGICEFCVNFNYGALAQLIERFPKQITTIMQSTPAPQPATTN